MLISVYNSKIHRAVVTEANLNYEGSLTIDTDLMKAAGIAPFEKVHVLNVTNGNRLVTYAIEGEAGSGVICLNGAAAHKGQIGDIVIVICYGLMDENETSGHRPKIILVDQNNKIIKS
ncbi:MAG: aspartate 1-decarboxylase [Candidatus Zixiibacteriota bacterium]|nr:MAG: aspartate 1-decarboxylase [candidate division Zixibacteria bacterium]